MTDKAKNAHQIPVKSFTTQYRRIVPVLISEVQVARAYDPTKGQPHVEHKLYKGCWDTGATGTVITKRVVDDLRLQPISITKAHGVDGEYEANVYAVNLILRNNVGLPYVQATEGKFEDFDLLIGMNVITMGDFAVTNYEGQTIMSFRIPSMEVIDFVNQKPNPPKSLPYKPPQQKPAKKSNVGRNDPCPCGSGKKYKKCCGK
ncbi:MAG: SEC-C metal-binding domain-containing protein [Desulfosalsimonas sp.]